MKADRLDLAIVLALSVACGAIYGQTASFEFVGFDDGAHVTRNPVTQGGLSAAGLVPALTHPVAANWHPLTQLSHMLDVELFGLDPGRHHAVNALLHLLATWLVFAVVRAATGARWRSAFVAGLFAVHPLHVEVVAWVSQRKTLLCTVFGLASTWAYVSYARRGAKRDLWASLALLGAGLLAKPMLVTLPFLFAVLDFWPLQRARSLRDAWALGREKLLLLVPVVAAGIVTIVAQQSARAVAPLDFDALVGVNLPNAALGYAWYLGKAVWPVGLAVHYPHPYLPLAGGTPPPAGAVAAVSLLLVVVVAAAVWLRRSRPWLLFGVAWAGVALVPVIGIVQVGTQGVADRYAYLTLLGPFIAVTWEAAAWCRRWPPVAVGAVALASLLGLGAAAQHQAGYWRDSRALFGRALEISPRSVTMSFNMGNAELQAGEYGLAEGRYRDALSVDPGHSPSQLNLADVLRKHGTAADVPEAIALYRRVLAARPGNRRAERGLRKTLAAQAESGEE